MIANLCASALKSGAKVILSEDMNSGQSIAGIQIEDPFL
jgi:predicted nucleic acid-binding protein